MIFVEQLNAHNAILLALGGTGCITNSAPSARQIEDVTRLGGDHRVDRVAVDSVIAGNGLHFVLVLIGVVSSIARFALLWLPADVAENDQRRLHGGGSDVGKYD